MVLRFKNNSFSRLSNDEDQQILFKDEVKGVNKDIKAEGRINGTCNIIHTSFMLNATCLCIYQPQGKESVVECVRGVGHKIVANAPIVET